VDRPPDFLVMSDNVEYLGLVAPEMLCYSDDESMNGWGQLAARYAAVCAQENTREGVQATAPERD
jgi:hypothetical protein